MSMVKRGREFPKYASHLDVVCFNCGSKDHLGPHRVDSFPVGKYRKVCVKCRMLTWYDLEPAR